MAAGKPSLPEGSVTNATGYTAPAMVGDAVLVHKRQKGNPVLNSVKSVPWRFADIGGPDFVVGRGVAAVFVSLQYHLLHPRYATKRMRGVGREYRVKVLLVQVDAGDNDTPLQELCRDAMAQGFVTLLGWSAAEAGRYVEALKSMEHAPAKAIMPRREKGLRQQAMTALTAVRSVNRSDADALAARFRTVGAMARAGVEDMVSVPGLGTRKARRVLAALTAPFTALGPEAAARERAGLPASQVRLPQYSAAAVSESRKRRRAEEAGQSAPKPAGTTGQAVPRPGTPSGAPGAAAKRAREATGEDTG